MRGRLEPKDTVERFWGLKFIGFPNLSDETPKPHFRVPFPLSVRHIGNHGALKGECQNLETPTKREDTQIVDEKSKIHAPKILRILILPPNEPPKSANFAVSTRTHMGGTKQDP